MNPVPFLFFLTIICSLTTYQLVAQCPPGSLTLLTQADVDAFATTYPTCTHIAGNLVIGPSSDISNLNGISGLTSVESLLIQNCPNLNNINGLSGLTSISSGGQLIIQNADAITAINWPGLHMPSLSQFRIESNHALTSVSLPQFAAFDGQTCQVANNDVLLSLDLSGLTTVNASNGIGLQTSYNSSLTHLDITSLTTSNGLWIQDQSLATIVGGNLQTLTGGGLVLRELPYLADVAFLSSLLTFNGFRLHLQDLPLLPDFSSMINVPGNSITTGGQLLILNADAITTISLPDVHIPSLSQFRIESNNSLVSVSLPQFAAFDGQTCQVANNDALISLDLSGLTTVNASNGIGLQTSYNSSLTHLDITSLTTSNGLWIQDQSLATIVGGNLQTLTGGGLVLRELPNLADVAFLSSLSTFNGFRLYLQDLPLLPDFSSIINAPGNSITTGGQLLILNADAITTISLPDVHIPSLSQFRIESNHALASVSLPQFAAFDGQTCQVANNDVLLSLDLSGLTTVNASNGIGLQTSYNSSLTHLDITSLTTSNGLWIQDQSLATIVGGNLQTLTGGGLVLRELPNLADVTFLSSLSTFNGFRLYLQDLPLLPDFSSMINVPGNSITTGGQLLILNADAITTISLPDVHIPSLSQFRIESNNALTSVSLPQFAVFDGQTCQVANNDALISLDLSGLTTVNASNGIGLQTSYNSSLTHLDITSLTTSNGLWIQGQTVLSSLGSFPALIHVNGNIRVSDNPVLCDCAALQTILDGNDDGASGPGSGSIPDVSGTIIIDNNLTGCNTVSEILSGSSLPSICYLDADQDTYGDPNFPMSFCGVCGSGYVVDNSDCDDSNDNIFPGAGEMCDGIDNNCNGIIDENDIPQITTFSLPIDPLPLGTSITASATFSDANDQDGHTAQWDWGDGNVISLSVADIDQLTNSISSTHAYGSAGVYTVSLTITDACGDQVSETSSSYIVIYDSSAGFVTGGGWIQSPAGAYVADPTLTGKANFGFVAKYQQGQSVPSGNTQFHLNVASFKFKSTSYDWLVIAGPNAKYKGSGTVNNQGNYGFMLTGVDGDINGGGGLDKFRIKIWDKNNGNGVVYDNKMGSSETSYDAQALGGGKIQIHKNGSNRLANPLSEMPGQAAEFSAAPNPFRKEVKLTFELTKESLVRLQIFNMQGMVVRSFELPTLKEGAHQVIWDGREEKGRLLPDGVYVARLEAGGIPELQRLVLIR